LNQRFAFGPEPLENDFTVEYLKDVLAARKAPVKSLLLDQKIVAGIGNIYADESLFKAKIHPARSVPTLSKEEIKKLHKSIREILKLAIERGGSSSRNYVRTSGEQGSFQNFHKVYKKSGLPCPRCGTAVERIVIAGRGTHFCPKCQI
jgi:formamidopyrimidine-DNA glycosylase